LTKVKRNNPSSRKPFKEKTPFLGREGKINTFGENDI